MKPDARLISIKDNKSQVVHLLNDLVLLPRLKALEWANITKQTPNMKVGYPGQHLASLVTGMPGTRTGARGHDLVDGSEAKSCSRVDQLDKCNDCDAKVMRIEETCPECGSTNIKRNNDSKWLFTIRSGRDLEVLTKEVPRVVLALADYPSFDSGDFETLRFAVYEIWPQYARHSSFTALMKGYYESIYQGHKEKDAAKTPAPKNFWPWSFQFYKCNPVQVFQATVKYANTKPQITVDVFVDPAADRATLTPLAMPSELLTADELALAVQKGATEEIKRCLAPRASLDEVRRIAFGPSSSKEMKKLFPLLPYLSEALRESLSLRDTDRPISFTKEYRRR